MEKRGNNFKDITGQKFGKLTAIEYAGFNKQGKALWKCRCDCGGECVTTGVNLRSGKRTSCGCKGGVFKDLTGKRFWYLTVVEYAGSGKDGSMWLCQCDCGNACTVASKKLTSGYVRSCGCKKERLIDLTGQRFGRLVVIEQYKSLNGHTRWLCQCDCGEKTIVHGNSLKSGNTKSCGCISLENKQSYGTHKMSKTAIFHVWLTMKQRCNNPNSKSFNQYGARGISVCKEWEDDFSSFYEWSIANGYKENLTIDRIDNDGNYEPSNCRWVDHFVQANNKRNNVFYEINGEKKTLAQWCREYGMDYSVVSQRIHKLNYDIERALTTPIKRQKRRKKT